jgi:hypothetical protein
LGVTTLQAFIDQVTTIMRAQLPGIKVPNEPELMPTKLPLTMVYASEGRGGMAPAGAMTYYHNVRVAFVGPLEELGRTNDYVLSRFEAVVEAVYSALANGQFNDVANIGDFSYSMGPDEWGGISVYGLFMTFDDVKIQRIL